MIDPAVTPSALALCHDPSDGINWWRIAGPFARLRQHRVDARVERLIDHGEYRIRTDGVVILPRLAPNPSHDAHAYVEQMIGKLRASCRAVIYDVDDDLFSEHYVQHHLATRWGDGKTAEDKRRECAGMAWAMGLMDGVTVASEPLAELVRSLVSVPVQVVPNAIDARWFRSRLSARSLWAGPVTIGWAGGRRPAADFRELAEAWRRVAKLRPDVRFVVVGDDSVGPLVRDLPSGAVERIAFGDVQDSPMAYQVDIGCCSVEDEPFNRCKTPIKAWEYALAGAAVVATPALYQQDVADGFTGRLAQTADEWEAALVELIDDSEQRRHLNANLVARVEQRHTLDGELWRWPAAWQAIAESRKAAAA